MGPGLAVRGGVSAVEKLIIDSISRHVQVEHVATMEDGGILRRIRVFGAALWRIHSILRDKSPCIFHVHFASRGSTLRKCIVSLMVLRASGWLVLHAHGAGFDSFFSNLPKPLQDRVARTFRRSHGFVVLSTQWQEFYATQLALCRDRIQIMVNPTDPTSPVPDRSRRDSVQFLFLGRIDDRKGAFELLDAYRALPTCLGRQPASCSPGMGGSRNCGGVPPTLAPMWSCIPGWLASNATTCWPLATFWSCHRTTKASPWRSLRRWRTACRSSPPRSGGFPT